MRKNSHYIELIPVRQRMSKGVRMIIFRYVAEVDSCGQRMAVTQEEGKGFDVDWVRMEDAPLRCSYADDGKIVEKALEAVPHPPSQLES